VLAFKLGRSSIFAGSDSPGFIDNIIRQVWSLFNNADEVRQMIMNKVQEESLRTYLFTYSSIYDSLSMEILAEMFELPKSTIHSIVSKMIINEELMVSYACLLTTSGYCYTQCYSHL